MNPYWYPSAAERWRIEAAARGTTYNATQIAAWLGFPAAKVAEIVADVRAREAKP